MPASDDIATALDWYNTLRSIGIEGVVAKRASSPYRPSRIWVKVRHSEPVDARAATYRPYRRGGRGL